MKLLVTMAMVALSASSLMAENTQKTIAAEAVIFDALCSAPDANGDVRLQVDLRAENLTEHFYAAGSYFSTAPSANQCEQESHDLRKKAGKTFFTDVEVSRRAYTAYETVWGICREHPLIGGGTYRCKKGTKPVTRYAQDVSIALGGINVVNKNY